TQPPSEHCQGSEDGRNDGETQRKRNSKRKSAETPFLDQCSFFGRERKSPSTVNSQLSAKLLKSMKDSFQTNFYESSAFFWQLLSGKIFDYQVFSYTLDLNYESTLHSFIIDMETKDLLRDNSEAWYTRIVWQVLFQVIDLGTAKNKFKQYISDELRRIPTKALHRKRDAKQVLGPEHVIFIIKYLEN
ncbi:hypothetical protein BGZ49_003550, partial [Haplosporangium sp. Z 27]